MQLYGTRHPLPDLSPTTDPLGLRLISCLAVSAQSWVCLLTPGWVPRFAGLAVIIATPFAGRVFPGAHPASFQTTLEIVPKPTVRPRGQS